MTATNRIISARQTELNLTKLPERTNSSGTNNNPAQINTSRLGETNYSSAYLKNKLLDFGNSTAAADTVSPVQNVTQSSAASPTTLTFEETKSVSDIAYEGKQGEVYQFPDGSYWQVDRSEEESSGFRAIAMSKVIPDGDGGYIDDPNDNRVAVGFAGTNGVDDVDDDLLQGVGFTPEQYSQAMEFTQEVMNEAAKNCETVNLAGHSLGGGLAAYVSIQTGLSASVINSAPLSTNKVPDDVNYDAQITQYYTKGEILTDLDNANPFDARPGKHVEVNGIFDEEAAVNSIPWWQQVFTPTVVTAVTATISIENHLLDNTAPQVAAPTKVYP